ncbi:MAG: hypothetical protein EBS42_14600, partial [Caulobacteraceae bacterium]|nr:hypothetical protein [Caulobacteraceae bacterium]
LATDSGSSNSDGVTNVDTVNVSGVESNATWQYTTNGNATTPTWTTGSGSTFTLAAGTYAIGDIRVRQTDLAGNTTVTPSQNVAAITVDVTAPAAPTFTLATDSGSSNSDGVTNVGTVNVSGVEANATWQYTSNGNATTPIWTTGTGSTFTLAAGTYAIGDIRVRQTDLAGNVTTTPSQNAAAITIDATAPSSLSTRTLALATASDSGTSNSDNLTNVATPVITVSTLNGLTMSVGEAIQIIDTSNSNAVVGSYTVVSGDLTSGAWNGTTKNITLSSTLSDGLHNLAVRLADLAGNTGTQSTATLGVTVDTVAPTTTVSSVSFSADTFGTNSSGTASDFITKTAAQTISGNLSANTVSGEVVRISLDNGTTWNTATNTTGTNTYSYSATLTASNTLLVRVEDAAGNFSTALSQAYVFDTTAPSAPTLAVGTGVSNGATSTEAIQASGVVTVTG